MNDTRYRDNVAKTFGDNLKRIREGKNITRKQLAEYLSVSLPTIAYYENGQMQPPLEKIFSIANFLQVSILDLTGNNGYSPANISVDKQIFKYRLQRAMEIASSADCSITQNQNGTFTIKFELNFMQNVTKSERWIVPREVTLNIRDAKTFVKMVEKTEKVLAATNYSYSFRHFFREIFNGANTVDDEYFVF